MTTRIIDCTDPDGNAIEEILRAHAERESRCKVKTAEMAQALIDAGTAKSERDAARIIAGETGEPEEAIRTRIKRGKRVGSVEPKKPAVTEEDLDVIRHGVVYMAKRFAHMAIARLESIKKDDLDRTAAFIQVKEWIDSQLNQGAEKGKTEDKSNEEHWLEVAKGMESTVKYITKHCKINEPAGKKPLGMILDAMSYLETVNQRYWLKAWEVER